MITQDGTDFLQLVLSDWLEENNQIELAADLRDDMNDSSPLEWRSETMFLSHFPNVGGVLLYSTNVGHGARGTPVGDLTYHVGSLSIDNLTSTPGTAPYSWRPGTICGILES